MIYEFCAAKVSLIPKDNGNILWLLATGHQPLTTDYPLLTIRGIDESLGSGRRKGDSPAAFDLYGR
jgi:hypothetical protein